MAQTTTTRVFYGPTYNADMMALTDGGYMQSNGIAGGMSGKHWRMRRLPNRKVLLLVECFDGDNATVFDTKAEADAYIAEGDRMVPDPETGRRPALYR